jgi:hypothetical protein
MTTEKLFDLAAEVYGMVENDETFELTYEDACAELGLDEDTTDQVMAIIDNDLALY